MVDSVIIEERGPVCRRPAAGPGSASIFLAVSGVVVTALLVVGERGAAAVRARADHRLRAHAAGRRAASARRSRAPAAILLVYSSRSR